MANPSFADAAVIETSVRLEDSSEAGINAAVQAALDSAFREAAARGFSGFGRWLLLSAPITSVFRRSPQPPLSKMKMRMTRQGRVCGLRSLRSMSSDVLQLVPAQTAHGFQ
jgi:hypothetical protein